MEASPAHLQRPSIAINLAHLNIVLKNYEAAINLYTNALEKFPDGHGDIETELYLAKAYFMNDQFEQSQKRLKSLVHRYPHDLRVTFDLAICLYEQAQKIFNKEFRRVADTNYAISCLKESQTLMHFLCAQNDASAYLVTTEPSEESKQIADFQLRFMRSVCEDRLSDLRQMLEESKCYLQLDEQREHELKEAEDQKLSKVKELQSAVEEVHLKLFEEEARKREEEQRNAEEASKQAQDMVDLMTKQLQEINQDKKGKNKGLAAAAAQDEQDFIDHGSYHDAPVEGEEDEGFGENENLSKHSENEAMVGLSGDSGADEDYSAVKSDEEEKSGKKKKKHDKDKKSKKIKKEKKEKKHKKDKKKHKKHDRSEKANDEGAADGEAELVGASEEVGEDGEPIKKPRRLQRMRQLDDDVNEKGADDAQME